MCVYVFSWDDLVFLNEAAQVLCVYERERKRERERESKRERESMRERLTVKERERER